jgi:hypothetical protein
MLGRVVATSAVLITLAGCADARSATTRGGIPSRASSEASLVANSSPADAAHAVCEKDAVRLENPVVRAQRDGVHILIENPGDAWGIDVHHDSWAHGTAEGVELTDEATPDTSAMGPRSVIVACLPTSHSSYTDPGAPTATLTIVDPDGLYVPWDLACGFGEEFRMKIAASTDEDPAVVFRRVPGIRPSDEFKTPKYPDSPQYWTTFIVLREGQAVARIMGPYDGGEWDLIVNACPGSGIQK